MRRRLVSSFARLALLGLVGAGLSGCIGEELRHGYQVDQAALATVKPGMAPEQVLQILGTPSTVSTVGNKSWYYISQNTTRTVMFLGEQVDDQKVIAVYFTPGFKVERVALYGLQARRPPAARTGPSSASSSAASPATSRSARAPARASCPAPTAASKALPALRHRRARSAAPSDDPDPPAKAGVRPSAAGITSSGDPNRWSGPRAASAGPSV